MKIKRQCLIIGILLVVLMTVVATQYATTKIGYHYNIVHPSDSDIRFIGSDNSSDDIRLLRVDGVNGTGATLKLEFNNISRNFNKTYTAAFAIVNEEAYNISITHINVQSVNITYMKIWLHGNMSSTIDSDATSVFMFDNGTIVNDSSTEAWVLAAGDDNASSVCANVSNPAPTTIPTPWDKVAHVRYTENTTLIESTVSDYVWVQVSVDVPAAAEVNASHSGTIEFHFKAAS